MGGGWGTWNEGFSCLFDFQFKENGLVILATL
jgi:hypothetical protein